MTESTSLFPCWAIIEIMGHQRYAGMVSEMPVAGVGMLRIDVPEVEEAGRCVKLEAYVRLVGVQSIYALTPCTEETARRYAGMIRKRAFELYDVPRIAQPICRTDGGDAGDYLDDDSDEDEDEPC